MAKTPPNSGKEWTKTQEQKLRQLAKQDTPTRLIAWKMGRSPDAIYSHAAEMDLSLKPTNQSPYNRRKA